MTLENVWEDCLMSDLYTHIWLHKNLPLLCAPGTSDGARERRPQEGHVRII